MSISSHKMEPRKRIKNNISSVVMCVCFACAVAALFLLNRSHDNISHVFHISSELFCMAVTLVMYMWHLRRQQQNDRSSRIFASLCQVVYFALFLDFVSWNIDGIAELRIWNYLINAAVFLLTFLHGVLYYQYILSHIEERTDQLKPMLRGIGILSIVILLFRILGIVSGQYFVISADGKFSHGPLLVVTFFAMPILSVFSCGIAAGREVSPRRLIAFCSYPVAILCMMVIALLNAEYANPLMAITLSMVFTYCATFLETEEQRDNLNDSLQIYLSDDIVNRLMSTDGAVGPGGGTVYLSMVFCTIHRFSTMMETMEPEEAVAVLNHFYDSMTRIVGKHEGTVLDFPGYGLFCIFGAVNPHANHAQSAVRAACDMQKEIGRVNQWNAAHNYPELSLGIGINTGDVVLGNIGSANHMRYSAISRHVNLASRIETYAGDNEIILTQTTLDACGDGLNAERISTIIPKGISEPIDIYRICNLVE